jgi:hypothetical protein
MLQHASEVHAGLNREAHGRLSLIWT